VLIRYDWQKIRLYAKGNANLVIRVIAYQTFNLTPKSKFDPMYGLSYTDWSGQSFLVHPERLLANRHVHTPRHIAQYVGIASYRSYNHYKITKQADLSVLGCPVSTEKFANNPLLEIVGDSIQFLYEA